MTVTAPSPFDDYLTGIAYGATLMPVRVLDRAGAGSAADVGEGILWAARNGADIINVSLQFDAAVTGCAQVPTVCDATREARRSGALVVAAAGNALGGKGKRRALYPGAAPGVLAVGATTEHGCLAAYSHFRERTDLLAPGGGAPRPAASHPVCAGDSRPCSSSASTASRVLSATTTASTIRPDLGTSMSAAHTSGVAALVHASGVSGIDPPAKRLAERLQCTARPGPTKKFYGPGMLDAAARDRSRAQLRSTLRPSARQLGGADDVDAAGGVVADLVRHAAEQEAPGAGHALVADHDQVRAGLLGDVEDRVRGIALARMRVDRHLGLLAPARRHPRGSR